MNEKVFNSSIIGFFAVGILGTILHFAYGLSGNNPAVGAVVPVNESVWEHLKLLFFPYMIYTFAEFFVYGRYIKGFLFSRITGLLCGLIMIPAVFFLYTAVIGRSLSLFDILLFFIADALSFFISTKRLDSGSDQYGHRNAAAIILFAGITALFIGLTFYPPSTALFAPPALQK